MVYLRLCDEDQEKYPGGDDGWVRFSEAMLDDLDLVTLNQFEADLNVSLEFLLQVDKPSQTVRWIAAQVWMARKIAGIDTPSLPDFNIKVRKVQTSNRKPKSREPEAVDVDPPDLSSEPSSEEEASQTASA